MSRWVVFLCIGLLQCEAFAPGVPASSAPSTYSGYPHAPTEAEITADAARRSAERVRCAAALYSPPSGDLAPLQVTITNHLGRAFDALPTKLCVLLDGALLFFAEAEATNVLHPLDHGGAVVLRTRIAQSGAHQMLAVVAFKGAGILRGWRFEILTKHAFAVTGPGGGELVADLYEMSTRRIEERPALRWHEDGEVGPPKGAAPAP
jgi:hypothetical protein